MEAVIDQPLGQIACADAELGLAFVAEHDLVHIRRGVRQVEIRLELFADIDRIQHRIHRGVAQSGAAMRQDVSQGSHQHAEVAVERAHAADGALALEIPRPLAADLLQSRRRQEGLERFLHGHRAGAGASTAVRRGEGLVQVEMHHVDAEIAGPRDSHQRVHVGAIHVKHGALGVQNLRRLHDVLFEDAERVGVGHHQRRHVSVRRARQRFQVQHACIGGFHVLHHVPGNRRSGRIGAVRGIGNQDLAARVAALLEQRANQQDACQLSLRAGRGLQRHRIHPGNFGEGRFQARHHFHGALRQRLGLIRMRPRQAFDARYQFIDPRVVFHGAGTQRVHAVIDGVVPGGKACEVADGFHFAHFGEALDFGAHVGGAQRLGRVHGGHIQLG